MFLITSSPTHIADTDTRSDNTTALSGFLAWLGLWMALVADGVLTDLEDRLYQKRFHYGLSASQIGLGYERGPSLLPEHARAAFAPRLLANRRDKRILGRGLPPSRQYVGLHHLNARRLTVGQFMERACRLSVSGRMKVYGLMARNRLCQRRHDVIYIGGGLGLKPYRPIAVLKPP